MVLTLATVMRERKPGPLVTGSD